MNFHIALDFDDIIANTHDRAVRVLKSKFGLSDKSIPIRDFRQWLGLSSDEEVELFNEILYPVEEIEPIPGAFEGIVELRKRHKLCIVSYRRDRQSVIDWMHYWEMPGAEEIDIFLVKCGDTMPSVDVMFDDSPGKLAEYRSYVIFQKGLILRTIPLNKICIDVNSRFTRVSGWREFLSIIDGMEEEYGRTED